MPNGIAYHFTFTRTTAVFLDIFRDVVLQTLLKFDLEGPHLYGRIRWYHEKNYGRIIEDC